MRKRSQPEENVLKRRKSGEMAEGAEARSPPSTTGEETVMTLEPACTLPPCTEGQQASAAGREGR